MNLVFGTGWSAELHFVLVFGLVLLMIWWVLFKLWERIGFMGSLEWFTGIALLAIGGKRSGKVGFKNIS